MTERQSGTQLLADRYAVRALIGRGGSGAVWRGEDLQLRRPVAIKQIVLGDARSTRSRTRAMREAQAVARLRAPGVVQVYDVIDDGAQVSLIMELIEAPSLARVVRRTGTLDPQRAARIGQSLLGTLLAVHAAGIVHRDVKPSNVLVDDDGVHITDFGIALLGDDPALTAAGSVLGTPAYMAPEQARGQRAGPAADLYGLGATLYFACEGHAPFADRGSVETTRAVREQPHRPGRHLGPLGPIVDALLGKDPATRPDAAAIAAALGAAAEGLEIAPPPTVTPCSSPGASPTGSDPTAEPAGAPGDSAPPDAPDADRAAGVGDAASDRSHGTTGPADPADRPRGTVDAPDRPRDADHDVAPADTTPPAGSATGDSASRRPRDEQGRQLRWTIVWAAALLVLLAVALLLLFLAVRDHPGTTAGAAAWVTGGTIMGGRPG